ncbi:MAG: DUF4124 domain-containing protein [Nitrospinae bacterium]|nr:DUF4124 domain-containing protein [Nitrospinota bacterium]
MLISPNRSDENRGRLILNLLVIIFLPVGPSSSSFAKTYKFRDENGKLHFTNDPSKVPEKFMNG